MVIVLWNFANGNANARTRALNDFPFFAFTSSPNTENALCINDFRVKASHCKQITIKPITN